MSNELKAREDSGFLCLPSTEIVVCRTARTETTTTTETTENQSTKLSVSERFPLNTWLQTNIEVSHQDCIDGEGLVAVVSGSEEENENKIKNGHFSKKPRLDSDLKPPSATIRTNQKKQSHRGCPNCQVILYPADNDLRIKCNPFNGTIAQRKSKCNCFIPENVKKHSRKEQFKSDANLLIGAAISSSKLGQSVIESMKVILHEKIRSNNIYLTDVGFYYASIIIIISPSKEKVKTPSPCTKFLFSMVQTDWNAYNKILSLGCSVHNQTDNKCKAMEDLLLSNDILHNNFPKELSLHELYSRMNTASRQHKLQYQQNTALLGTTASLKQTSILTNNIPTDVLSTYICSYLNAKSLYSLRCTCKYLFHVICNVIPGLKLKLYSHQIASLCWMRWREAGGGDDKVPLDEGKKNSSFNVGSLVPFRRENNGKRKIQTRTSSSDNEDQCTIVDSCHGGLLCDVRSISNISYCKLILILFSSTLCCS